MIAPLLAVFLLGMRHGADPDHLAAIDNITRRSAAVHPAAARFAGTLFAGGHTVMVLGIAGIIGVLGTRFGAFGEGLERAGSWLSVAILAIMALLNFRRLALSSDAPPLGVRARFLGALDRGDPNVLVALPIGFLFGVGFETSSQIAAYVMMASGGVTAALSVAAAFCLGMIFTDTCDSVVVSKLLGARGARRAARAWLWTVTLVAVSVAAYETMQLAGIPLVPELAVSAAIVVALFVVYGIAARKPAPAVTLPS